MGGNLKKGKGREKGRRGTKGEPKRGGKKFVPLGGGVVKTGGSEGLRGKQPQGFFSKRGGGLETKKKPRPKQKNSALWGLNGGKGGEKRRGKKECVTSKRGIEGGADSWEKSPPNHLDPVLSKPWFESSGEKPTGGQEFESPRKTLECWEVTFVQKRPITWRRGGEKQGGKVSLQRKRGKIEGGFNTKKDPSWRKARGGQRGTGRE